MNLHYRARSSLASCNEIRGTTNPVYFCVAPAVGQVSDAMSAPVEGN
jgi:hypothetical protein